MKRPDRRSLSSAPPGVIQQGLSIAAITDAYLGRTELQADMLAAMAREIRKAVLSAHPEFQPAAEWIAIAEELERRIEG